MTIWAILPAAGIGRRMGSSTPKQYLPVNGVPVIAHTLQRLAAVGSIARIVVVLNPRDSLWESLEIAKQFLDKQPRIESTTGADARQESVLNGLRALDEVALDDDWVLVHDAVRPCVELADIERLIASVQADAVGGLLATPVDNTLKQVDAGLRVTSTIDRSHYWNALTPQMFRYSLLKTGLEKAVAEKLSITDDAAAIELLGNRPKIVEGSKFNIKITHDADLELAAMILNRQATAEQGSP